MEKPLDRMFVDFLYCHFIHNDPADTQWKRPDAAAKEAVDFTKVLLRSDYLKQNDDCRRVLNTVQYIFRAMVRGDMGPFYSVFGDVKFDFIVGVPRSGGTYLLKEMYRGQGVDLDDVHYYMHDASPHIFRSPTRHDMSWEEIDVEILFDMVQMAAAGRLLKEKHGLEYVPKKCHGVPLVPALFAQLFPESRYIITWREFDGMMASIKDKCGLPRQSIPESRSEIERHIHTYLLRRGWDRRKIKKAGYHGGMRQFYDMFYKDCEVLPVRRTVDFGEGMQNFVAEIYEKNGLPYTAEKFHDRRRKGKAA